MAVTGVIAEYNPFHNGHALQISKIKEETGNQIVVAMSGNWVQRGTPAIINKYLRTKMALLSGADIVIELPTHISTGAAGDFAYGSTSLLNSLGCVDNLCFGCETDNNHALNKLSTILVNEPKEFSDKLRIKLKNGLSFPRARYESLLECGLESSTELEYITSPNNLLGLEYAIALKRMGSLISTWPIARKGSGYDETSLDALGYSSASAIRHAIYNEGIESIHNHMPDFAYELLKNSPIINENDFSSQLKYKLLMEEDFTRYLDISKELSDRINNFKLSFADTVSFTQLLKTKNMTYSHISRCLCHILLNLPKDIPKEAEYIRVLGFRKESQDLLSLIKNSSGIPLITKLSQANINLDSNAYQHLLSDITASQLYDSHNEFSTPMVII